MRSFCAQAQKQVDKCEIYLAISSFFYALAYIWVEILNNSAKWTEMSKTKWGFSLLFSVHLWSFTILFYGNNMRKITFSIIFPFILKFTLEVGNVRIFFDISRAEKSRIQADIFFQNIYSLVWLDGSNNKTWFFLFLNSVFFQKFWKILALIFVIMICVPAKG